MIKNGADWLHMGPFISISAAARKMTFDPSDGCRRNGRVNGIRNAAFNLLITDAMDPTAISYRTSPWVRPDALLDRSVRGSLINSLRRPTCAGMRSQRGPGDFYGLPYDGFQTRTGGVFPKMPLVQAHQRFPLPQWVDAIANAGGKLYCFHIEATCE